MKRICMLFVLAGVAVSQCFAALDLNAPDWRGDDGTTYQVWDFSTSANPSDADDYVNVECPCVVVYGNYPYTRWKESDLGEQGVWAFEDYMLVNIPNIPQENPYKEIWLQIVYWGDGEPEIFTDPQSSSMTLVDEQTLDSGYIHATYSIIIEPNPFEESIFIMPRNCTLYVDNLVIDTICVPEPLTLGLLGIGALLIRRRKR